MNYSESIAALLSLVDHERAAPGPRQKAIVDLSRMESFLARLGNPHRAAATIHVAGTKGKGSTAAFCDAALTAAGYRTGFNSSPHMHHFRERIRLDGEPISEPRFASLVEQLWPFRVGPESGSSDGTHGTGETDVTDGTDELKGTDGAIGEAEDAVTLFEFITGMAFQCFAQEPVDFQTIEVGLGGRLDATNVVTPEVAVITSISMDHMAILGDTLPEIASEKAGIIKEGSAVVISPQAPEAGDVVRERCRQVGARAVQVGYDVTWTSPGPDGSGFQSFTVYGRLGEHQLRIPLLGEYQLENAATALAVLEVLVERGWSIPPESIVRGFAGVSWPCRMEILSRDPAVVADGAHNVYSVESLMDSLPMYLPHRRLLLAVGFSRDKSVVEMAQCLSKGNPVVFATRSRHPRSMAPAAVARLFEDQGVKAVLTSDTAGALRLACEAAGPNDLVLATGSLFVAAEAREAVLGIQPEEYPDLLPRDLRVG